jgi:polyisoprenoid-binding protein YceI
MLPVGEEESMFYRWSSTVILVVWFTLSGAVGPLAADMYVTDPMHTSVSFTVRHLTIYKVRGKFNAFSGIIMYDENDLAKSSMHGTIQAASLDTDNEKRDNDLRGAQFLETEKFPEITFVSKRIEAQNGGNVLIGDLTMHGVTKEIAIPFTILGKVVHRGTTLLGFEASVQINRHDFGITYNKVMDNGGLIVGNTVEIELIGRAIKKES